MTLQEYIMNPYPNGVISSQSREMTRNMYIDKFNKTMLREAGKQFPAKMYIGKSSWYLHLKVPSEVVPDFTYDVVFEFLQVKNTTKLEDSQVRFYSNDPAFVFTYANTFKNHGLLCKELESKMPKKALNTKANEKNPANIVGYVKSIYFAYLLCQKYNYLNITLFKTKAKDYRQKDLLSDVMDATLKIAQRQEAQEEINKQKRIEKGRSGTINKNSMEHILNPEVQTGRRQSKTISNVKTTKTITPKNTIKKTKTVKRI